MVKPRVLRITDMEPIAKEVMHNALTGYIPPTEEQKKHLTLGKVLTDTEGVFELYVPADRPQDATVISRVTIDRMTGGVKVEVFLTPQN
ncbi:hypothetical protein THUN1379_06710 [Paludibacterium sp. THUN1379]|nr:hypothetical protein THUN1379_06710 [Paludibacterium sp. THUN1379]